MKNKRARIDVYVSEDVQASFKNYLNNLDEKVSASGFLNEHILDVIGNQKSNDGKSTKIVKDDKKDCYLNTRLTKDENDAYEKSSKEYGFKKRNSLLLKLIREEINKKPELNDEQIIELREANRNLLGIGRNLNQIARKLNSEEQVTSPITPEYIKMLVSYIKKQEIAIMKMVSFSERRSVVSSNKVCDEEVLP